MVLNSLSFCLSVRLLFSHQIQTRAFLSRVFLVISFSLLLLYIYLATPFLPTNIADSLMGNLLYVTSCFSFVGFNIFSVFHFCLFEQYVPYCVPPCVYPYWHSVLPVIYLSVSFAMLGNFLALISLSIFSGPFSLSSFQDSNNVNVGACNIVPEVSDHLHFFFHSSFFILFHGSVFHYACLSSHLLIIQPHLFCY